MGFSGFDGRVVLVVATRLETVRSVEGLVAGAFERKGTLLEFVVPGGDPVSVDMFVVDPGGLVVSFKFCWGEPVEIPAFG